MEEAKLQPDVFVVLLVKYHRPLVSAHPHDLYKVQGRRRPLQQEITVHVTEQKVQKETGWYCRYKGW